MATTQGKGPKEVPPEQLRFWVQVVSALAKIADQFGISFAVIVILLASVWQMGDAETQNDFIRELLFGSVTNTRQLTTFFVVLVVISVFGLDTKVRAYRTESAEMKRLADEKTQWQERALGQSLSHTEDERL
jgi:chromate transport protein ChrA